MKQILLVFAFIWPVLTFTSCKKAIEDQKRSIVLQIMTNGRWYLQSYYENGFDYTADFMDYEFQFHENETIDAIVVTSAVPHTTTGTWFGDVNNLAMTVNFPATDKLLRLNHVWKVTDTEGTVAVRGETETSFGKIIIIFRKKS